MRFTVVGDLHAKNTNLDKINKVFDIIEDLGNPVILLGDLLDTKELIRGKCLNTYFDRLRQSTLEFIIIVGNHDYFNLDCKEHSLHTLRMLPNVRLVDEPTVAYGLGFCPFIKDPSDYAAAFKAFSKDSVIFGHFDIKGFDYGNGHISEEGLTSQDLRDFSLVISGHYHKMQKRNNIIYLGTPFSHSFGETDQTKFIGVFDDKSGNLDLIKTPFPRHCTYEMAADKIDLSQIDPNNYNRLIVTGRKDLVDKVEVDGVKVIKRYDKDGDSLGISEAQTPIAQFEQWASAIKNLDNDLISLGKGILTDV